MYYLLFVFIYLFSLLPLKILYGLSAVIRWILFGWIKYRRDVVYQNLSQAFAEKEKREIKAIQKQFEMAFCDQWVEVIKLMSISPKALNRRVSADWTVFDRFFEENRSVHVFLGHQFNWEMANLACQYNTLQQFAGLYLPLSSRIFDRIMLYIRSRMGSVLINAHRLKSEMKPLIGRPVILGVIADQSNNNLDASYWYNFLNKACPFTFVPEKNARLFKSAVLFAATHKVKKGHYKIEFTLISENAREEKEGFIMDSYVTLLEKSIREQPFNWLWSHKRWKKVMPEGAGIRNTGVADQF